MAAWYDSLVLMFQREVAERIVARRGSKSYGRLTVLAQWRTEPRILFDIAPSAFVPPPKVVSSLVRLVPRAGAARLATLCTASSASPLRLSASAARCCGKACARSARSRRLLAAAAIDPTRAARDIPVAGFVALSRALPKDDDRSP